MKRGLDILFSRLLKFSTDIPTVKIFGLKEGALTRASISPLFGSIATIEPRFPFNKLVARTCKSRSIDPIVVSAPTGCKKSPDKSMVSENGSSCSNSLIRICGTLSEETKIGTYI